MPVFLPLVLGPLLVSAETPMVASPTATQASTACATLRVLDQPRALTRWAKSPFPNLAATAWGSALAKDVDQNPGFFRLLRQILPVEHGVLAVQQVTDGQPFADLTATLGANAPKTFAFPVAERTSTTLTARIPLAPYALEVLFGRGESIPWASLPALPMAATFSEPRPESDLELTLIPPFPQSTTANVLRASWTITSYGLHEQAQLSNLPTLPTHQQLPVAVSVAQLAGLPPTTTWAVAAAAIPGVVERLPGFDHAVYDAWASTQQLPLWSTVRTQLGGAVMWSEQGLPLPSFSLVIDMPKSLGDVLLTWLDRNQEFSPNGDGTHLGVLGFVPLQAGWRDGKLAITTHGGGISAALARPGGFAKEPEVVRAVAEAKLTAGDQLIFGASRSGESWGTVASIAPWLMRSRPAYATLAADLRRAGNFGFVTVARTPDTLALSAGGLFGGPLANSAILRTFMQMSLPVTSSPMVSPPPTKLTEY